jgi:hypothetical protein
MRAVFINYVHPQVRHVSSMRMQYFARALARRGHEIVLLTCTMGSEPGTDLAQLPAELGRHDWREPFHVGCAPVPHRTLNAIRAPGTPKRWRQALILKSYLFTGGLFADWTAGSRPYWPVLREYFRPQISYGSFGNLDTWLIAQGIARCAGIPWVMDIKDDWGIFIPYPLRAILARRVRDGAALTTNSRFLLERTKAWFPAQEARIVYSGADECWLADDACTPTKQDFRITLIGSIYSSDRLSALVAALAGWLRSLNDTDRARVVFSYAGTAVQEVARVAGALADLCRVETYDYLAQAELAKLCRESAVNAYLWSPRTFHHKLIELLCSQRPVIAFPGEYEEASELAEQVGGRLYPCTSALELQQALGDILAMPRQHHGRKEDLHGFSWTDQAVRIEELFSLIMGDAQWRS